MTNSGRPLRLPRPPRPPRGHRLRLRGVSLLLAVVVAGCSPAPSPRALVTASPASTVTPAETAPATLTPSPAPTPEPTPASAIAPGQVDRSSLAVTATYDVDLQVGVAAGTLAVTTDIEARNDSGAGIDRLELNAIATRLGAIEVIGTTVDDAPVTATIDDQTLDIPLGGILPPGATARVRVSYTATLRHDLAGSDWLFSRAGGTLALYRWIPWISRAVPFDRPNHGDPFVTPTSPDVRVRVTTDLPMVLASPGAQPTRDGEAWTFEVRDVRDVAILLAPDFAVTTGSTGGVAIRVYARPGGLDGSRVLAQAEKALTAIGDRLGVPYPWSDFTVVETAGGYGMESPGLIWIPSGTLAANLTYLVHHESAHQWFYGLVGNDQQAEPFADEAMADMVARSVLGLSRASRCARSALDGAITAYSQACYFEDVYIQGGLVLDQVRRAMGNDLFWATVHDYVEANRFGISGTRQLLDALRAASRVDLLPILRSRFPSLYP